MSDTKTKRPALERFMTPLGTLSYPKLNKPDEFKGKKRWQAPLKVARDDVQDMLDKYDVLFDKAWEDAQAEAKARLADAKTGADKQKAKKALDGLAQASKAYEDVLDDDGNETGFVLLRIQMNAEVEKDGKVRQLKPDFFDAKGKVLKVVPNIWGGTTAHLAGQFNPYSSTTGVGVSLRLNAVQIIELSNGSSRGASEYGFGAQEGGFDGAAAADEGESAGEDRMGDDAAGEPGSDEF